MDVIASPPQFRLAGLAVEDDEVTVAGGRPRLPIAPPMHHARGHPLTGLTSGPLTPACLQVYRLRCETQVPSNCLSSGSRPRRS